MFWCERDLNKLEQTEILCALCLFLPSLIERFGSRFHSLDRVHVDHVLNEGGKRGVNHAYRAYSLCFGLECSS